MARTTLPSDVIASRGVKLDLVGKDVTLVYSFRALALVEEHFDSVQLGLLALSQKANQAESTAKMIACALTHEVDDDGAPLSNVDNLWPYLDTLRVDDYHSAIVEALANAVPAVRDALSGKPDPTPGETAETADSPGENGSTSEPSSSDDQTKSSGE